MRYHSPYLAKGLFFILLAACLFINRSGHSEEPADVERLEDKVKLEVLDWTGKPGEKWTECERLVKEEKYEKASEFVMDLLEKAKSKRDSEEWVRALIHYVQVRTALHGYETAVRFLKEEAWPEDLLGSTVLNLFYTHSLVRYAQAYSWEIRQREKVESKGVVDLKAWTLDQIYENAHETYAAVWKVREQLGEHPVKHLDEYVKPNNYPRDIRGTLRDAVSYLWFELLSDTSGWRLEHSNEIYQLDLDVLMGEARGESNHGLEKISLVDPMVHPLVKACAILDDLEKWHESNGEKEAAFEARLRRIRVLHTHFNQEADHDRIKQHLRDCLTQVRQLQWWAVGMSTLAEFVREEDAGDALIHARSIAQEGYEAYPDGIGGKRCLHIIKSIEMPDFNLEGMASDAPGKRSVGGQYKNLERLFFRAYPVDLKKYIEQTDDYNLFPDRRELDDLLRNWHPSYQWDLKLSPTPDYRMHRMYSIPPMKKPGLYVVVASAKQDFEKRDNRIQAINMVVGDLVMLTRQEGGGVDVEVLSGSTGRPVSGVEVHLYQYDYQKKHHSVDLKKTGKNGTVSFTRNDSQRYFLFAQKNNEVAIDSRALYLSPRGKPSDRHAVLIYTDRSIYRPLQTIHFKVVAYKGRFDKANYKVAPSTQVAVSLRDANRQEVAKKTVTTNSYGTASGAFTIPAGRLLGLWQLRSSYDGYAFVRVEEYKRPTFETKIRDPETPLRLNKQATMTGEARYYFGLPVTSGEVKWRVVRTPVFPWWWRYYDWRGGGGSTQTQTMEAGRALLNEDGTFSINFVPKADERLAAESKDLTYQYTLFVDVTDEGGETRSAERSFRLGFVAVEATVNMDTQFFLKDHAFEFDIVRTNLDGVPEPGKGKYRIVALQMPEKALLPVDQPMAEPSDEWKAYSTSDDMRRQRWNTQYRPEGVMRGWPDGKEKAKGKLTHDEKGMAKVKLSGLPAGAYRVYYTTHDAFEARFEVSKEFIVADRQSSLALPAFLQVEKTSVHVGETARIFAVSGLENQLVILDLYRNGERIERHLLDSEKGETLLEIPITEEQRGGFGVTLTAIRDHQFMHFTQNVFVPWDNKELKVAFSTFRDLLRPGEREKWRITVKGPSGKETDIRAAEVLAYMYDRSLDAFAQHSPPSPLSLFPNLTRSRRTRSNLGVARRIWLDRLGFEGLPSYPVLLGDTLRVFDEYSIGGPGRRGTHMLYDGVESADMDSFGFSLEKPRLRRASSEALKESEVQEKRETDMVELEKARAEATPEIQVRADFSETAFWQPHLLTGEDGAATIEFMVPDSVTSWNVWVHAVTRDFQSGSIKKEARTIKDLMVRPYLPRFLREGDQAAIKVVVNNASDKELKGYLTLDIIDPDTEKSILDTFGLSRTNAERLPFTVKAGGGTNLSFDIETPAKVGLIAFKVTAQSGEFSDGELRPIPVLPGRMHLVQSRFVTLKDKARREMHFADMAKTDDPSLIHEQMVVTIDAQLFYSVLSALPYLVTYPYECTEQTLNRFISTGILESMYKDYPAIEQMAKTFSKRETQYETWDSADPNRKMAMEEMPWLEAAKGGPEREYPLINVLDPRITRTQRDVSLAKLKESQTSSGGFPWFPGGPPSPYMTLYILYGFSKGLEFGIEVPQDMIHRAWRYMHRHYIDELVEQMMSLDCCWEVITLLNYTLSNYPDASWTGGVFSELERKNMVDFSFRHWKEHSPYLKGYLALTLKRMGRNKDAILVWESVMDSARTEEDQGTFWASEDRGWLWYNDTIETHAFAIRTVMELTPMEEKLDGLVLWIFLNKKLNHWKSTRATAEVIYSLAHYLKKTEQLGAREEIEVTAGDIEKEFVFLPDEFTGKKNQLVIPGKDVDEAKHASIVVEKETKGYAFASANWHFSTDKLPKEARGDYLSVTRNYFKRVKTGREVTLLPLNEGAKVSVGDEVEVHLSLTAKHPMEYVHLRDPRPAGFEPVSFTSAHKWGLGIYWYEEVRDSGTNFFLESIPQGNYPFKYRLRAAVAGTFKAGPATVQPMYSPEFTAYSSGRIIGITATGQQE